MPVFGPSVSTITSTDLTDAYRLPCALAAQTEISAADLARGTILVASNVTPDKADRVVFDDVSGSALGRCTAAQFVFAGLVQPTATSGAGTNLIIRAQDAQSGSGGSLVLLPGDNASSGSDGVVSIQQPGGTPGTDQMDLSHGGSSGGAAGGSVHVLSGGQLYFSFGGSTRLSFNSTNNALFLGSTMGLKWTAGASPLITSPDLGLARTAAKVLTVNDGSSGTGWVQNSAGTTRLSANVTNATTTMTNLTGLSQTLIAGRRYCGKLVLFCANSTAAEGVKIDFDGGTATMTSFRAHGLIWDSSLLASTQTSAITTDILAATITGDSMIVVEFALVCNAAGTFIPRAAENSTATGTLTVYLNSYMLLEDSPV